MPSITCVFCAHENPAGAKYCNDCAAPLTLKPCPNCEAVNDRSALTCYKCGSPYPADVALAEIGHGAAAPESLADAASFAGDLPPSHRQPSPPDGADRPALSGVPAPVSPFRSFERSPQEVARELFTDARSASTAAEPAIASSFAGRDIALRVGLGTIVVLSCAAMAFFAYRFPAAGDAPATNAPTASSASGAAMATPISAESEGSKGSPAPPAPVAVPSTAAVSEPTQEADHRVAESDAPATAGATPSAQPTGAPPAPGSMPPVSAGSGEAHAAAPSRASLERSHSRGAGIPSAAPRPARDPADSPFAVTPPVGGSRNEGAAPPVCTSNIAALGLCTPIAEREGT